MPSTPGIQSVIRKALYSKGWKAVTLAKELNVSPSTVSRWLNGQSDPDIQLWPQIEHILGLPDAAILNAKHTSLENEYQGTRERMAESLKFAGSRLKFKQENFDNFKAFYAYYLDNDFSIAIIAQVLDIPAETVTQWVLDSTPPPKEHWAAIEAHYKLPGGTLQRTADKEAANLTTVDPDKVAAHGDLRDEDRPAIAAMLQQVLEQQAQIVKRLDELDPDK